MAAVSLFSLNFWKASGMQYLLKCCHTTQIFHMSAAGGEPGLPYDVNDEAQLDQYPAHGRSATSIKNVPIWKRIFWEGGRPFDAFLTIISAQVRSELGQPWQHRVSLLPVEMAGPICSCTQQLMVAGK